MHKPFLFLFAFNIHSSPHQHQKTAHKHELYAANAINIASPPVSTSTRLHPSSSSSSSVVVESESSMPERCEGKMGESACGGGGGDDGAGRGKGRTQPRDERQGPDGARGAEEGET